MQISAFYFQSCCFAGVYCRFYDYYDVLSTWKIDMKISPSACLYRDKHVFICYLRFILHPKWIINHFLKQNKAWFLPWRYMKVLNKNRDERVCHNYFYNLMWQFLRQVSFHRHLGSVLDWIGIHINPLRTAYVYFLHNITSLSTHASYE
jgi:hypothetical protein